MADTRRARGTSVGYCIMPSAPPSTTASRPDSSRSCWPYSPMRPPIPKIDGGRRKPSRRSETMAVVSPQVLRRYWQPTVTYCRPRILPALLLVGVLVLSTALVFVPIDWKMFGEYGGYLGIFLVTLLATGAIILPVPYLGLIVNAGASPYLNPLLVALIAGVAAALGELTGYLVGYTGRALLPRNRWWD